MKNKEPESSPLPSKVERTAETLKAYSDTCDEKPAFLFIKSACANYEPFTHDGLNQLPHRFLPAIAQVMEEYASQFKSSPSSPLNPSGVDLEESQDDKLYDAVLKALRDYRLSYTKSEDEEGMHLVDRMTPPEDDDVSRGIDEINLLAEEIVEEIKGISSLEEEREQIASILRDNITFSGQTGDFVIHGAIDKIIEWANTRKK